MRRNYVALAIPFFFLLIGVELLIAHLLRRRVYRLKDAFSDLGCGITQQAIGVFTGTTIGSIFVATHARARLFDLDESSAATWVLVFLGVDFLYYWWHRLSHVVNLLWAGHVVHHQSEDMNLAVALRQAPLTGLTIVPFYLPLALVGFPPVMIGVAASINTLYQFWIHTELIRTLGPIEWVFNTPSHHRVHHGINPRYLDKNYGGILIVWDRLFGTFEPETERVVYGTVAPFRSFDPLWAQLAPLVHLAQDAWAAPHLLDKLKVWFAPPAWRPRGLPAYPEPVEVTPESRPKYDLPSSPRTDLYVLLQLALAVVATFLLLLYVRDLGTRNAALIAAAVLATLGASAALIEGRRFAWPLEASRVALVVAVLIAVVPNLPAASTDASRAAPLAPRPPDAAPPGTR